MGMLCQAKSQQRVFPAENYCSQAILSGLSDKDRLWNVSTERRINNDTRTTKEGGL